MKIPHVMNEPFSTQYQMRNAYLAAKLFRMHVLPDELDEWKKKRAELKKTIASKMRLDYNSELPLNVIEHGDEIRINSCTVKKISYLAAPGRRVSANLYLPDGKGPFPGVINMHGHWSQGRLAERIQRRGFALAMSGYVCLSVDVLGAGERSDVHGECVYHGGKRGGALENVSKTLMGIQLADNMRGVDLLCSLPYVDKSKIGATGASGGGNQTMYLAAMDERIKASVPVVSAGTFESYISNENCICETMPDGLTVCEESAIFALAAPNAVKICNALHDSSPTFYVSEMLRTYKNARKIFSLYNVADSFDYQAFNTTHGYWDVIAGTMLGFFALHLKGKGRGMPLEMPDFECLEEEKLMLFEKGKRPDDFGTIASLVKKYAEDITPDMNLKDILRYEKPTTFARTLCCGKDGVWEKMIFETTDGRLIPLLYVKGETDTLRVMSSSFGKDGLAKSPMLEKALKNNDSIVLFDVAGSGETGVEYGENYLLVPYHKLVRALQWLGGKQLITYWCEDYTGIARYFPAKRKILCGSGDTAWSVRFCTVLEKDFEVEIENAPSDITLDDAETMALCIPDIRRAKEIFENKGK